jgi:FKBP-type peptidyl-prolyl cis-trans isomerase 2
MSIPQKAPLWLLALALTACSTPPPADRVAQKGDTVNVDYTLTLDDGTVVDSSKGRAPLAFKIGGGQVIPGFDKGVTGMKVGEERTVKVPPEDGYGPYDAKKTGELPREKLGKQKVEKGQDLQLRMDTGTPITVKVLDVKDKTVTVDANHPLAGKKLNFKIKLVGVQ